jgi:ribonucleoside-diphosphate reductase alpha chain
MAGPRTSAALGIQYDDHQRVAHLGEHGPDPRLQPVLEYMFLNDTACNLASLNLMKFVGADGEFDVDAYRFAAR